MTALAQLPDEPVEQPHTGTKGVIEGTVVDGVTHKPLKGVRVMLQGAVLQSGTESSEAHGMPDYPITVTDAGGHFGFRGLPSGVYNVSASKPGVHQPSAVNVRIGADEQKRNVEISFVVNGSFSGKVVDEEGLPVSGCTVLAVPRGGVRGGGDTSGQAETDEKGAYRVEDLPAGHYRVLARCDKELPAAHPLLPRGDPRTPHETYAPELYGGGLDPSTATVLTMAAGSSQEGIDFQMSRLPAITLHVGIGAADPEALAGSFHLTLFPAGTELRNFLSFSEVADRPPSALEIHSVTAGAYLLVAYSMHEGRTFFAQRAVEVGDAPPAPVEISLAPGADLQGTVQFDSNDAPPIEDGQIVLAPLDHLFPYQQHRADIDKDGAFTITGVGPGRWRPLLSGTVGDHSGALEYIKSLSIGGQPAPAYGFEIGPGASGPLRIVLGTKLAEVDATVTGAAEQTEAFLLLYPEERERFDTGLRSGVPQAGNNRVEMKDVPPGHYRLVAIEKADLALLLELFQGTALMKTLGGRSASVDLPEGGQVEASVEVIPHDELKKAVEDRE